MDVKANSLKIALDYDGNVTLALSIDRAYAPQLKTEYAKIKDKTLRVDIKQWREKRSLDANAYAWQLIGKLADVLSSPAAAYSKDDMYLMMLKRYGQGGIVKIPRKDVERFTRAWKYCEEHEKLYDENAVYYRFWVGSSNYDTKEMSTFIDGIIDECKQVGIETMPADKVESMMREWNEKQS